MIKSIVASHVLLRSLQAHNTQTPRDRHEAEREGFGSKPPTGGKGRRKRSEPVNCS